MVNDRPPPIQPIMLGICIIAMLLAPLALLSDRTSPDSGPFLVVAFFGAPAIRIVEQANGYAIGPVRAPFGILADSDEPGFAARLREQGAWAVLNGQSLALICGADV